jgi:hypothetical protein
VARFFLALLAVGLLTAAACGDGDDGSPAPPEGGSPTLTNGATIVPVTPIARPDSVPESARAVEQTTNLGRIVRRAEQDPQAIMIRELVDASCENDVVRIETAEEVIYAAFPPLAGAAPCDRFWDEESAALFVGEQAALVLELSEERARVLIETLAGAQSEFTVGGIWLE